jgi:hypothetical protein
LNSRTEWNVYKKNWITLKSLQTPEYLEFLEFKQKYNKLSELLITFGYFRNNDVYNLDILQPLSLDENVSKELNNILLPEGELKGESHKTAKLMIPFLYEKSFVKTIVTIETSEFTPYTVFAFRLKGKKLVAVVHEDKLWCRITEYTDILKEALNTFSKNPQLFLSTIGKEIGCCCICSRDLSDPVSKENGIGPVCITLFRYRSKSSYD